MLTGPLFASERKGDLSRLLTFVSMCVVSTHQIQSRCGSWSAEQGKWKLVSRVEFGWAIPSRFSLLIPTPRLNLVLTHYPSPFPLYGGICVIKLMPYLVDHPSSSLILNITISPLAR